MSDARPEFKAFLRKDFLSRCRENGTYSLRTYAKFLDVDHTTLSKLLNGRRPIGQRVLARLAKRLGLSEAEIQAFARPKARKAAGPDAFKSLALDAFQVISDWQHFAILELMRLESFRSDTRWIATTLGLSAAEAKESVQRLQRIGLLEIDEEGRWHDGSGGKTSSLQKNVSSPAHKALQRQFLRKASEALEDYSPALRSQTSMCFAADPSRMEEAKERIAAFRRDLTDFLSRQNAKTTDVYHLSLSLYPVTTLHKEKST